MLVEYRGNLSGTRRRGGPLAISLVLHAAAFLWFVEVPGFHMPRAAESEYKQAIEGKEEKLVWYKFRKKLPAVTPPRKSADKRPLRAEATADQAIVSSPKEAPKRNQMAWTPEPATIAPPPLESPNILAIKLPDSQLPARPFVAPPRVTPPAATAPTLSAEAPLIETQLAPAHLRLPPKALLPPPGARRTAAVQTVPEAPLVAANILPGSVGFPSPSSARLPPRPFTSPPGSGRNALSRGVAVEPAPPVDSVANSKDLNLAIVGLNPTDRPAALPAAPSPAAFSAGPRLNPSGAAAEGGGKGLSVPDLFIKGPRETKPDLIAQAFLSPTAPETLRAAMRGGEPVMTVHVAPAPSGTNGNPAANPATKVSGAPDPRFNGRDVFMMAIQMPNLTSYSGSWLMWYADRTARETGLAPIAAPVAHRKVDPKYVATAVEERVEGTVTLGCVIDRDGKVLSVELIRGVDDRLNESAREALAKWEFYPAAREGVPIAVDVLVQIPFRLAPLPPRR